MVIIHQKGNFLVGGRTLKDELVGETVSVVESRVVSQVQLQGVICDETKEGLSIQTKTGVKVILKRDVVLRFLDGSLILGTSLIGRGSDRLKY